MHVEARGWCPLSSSVLSTLNCERGSLLACTSLIQLAWLATELQESSCLCPQSWGYQCTCAPSFFMAGDLNSGSDQCAASTFLSEPYPQATICSFSQKRKQVLKFTGFLGITTWLSSLGFDDNLPQAWDHRELTLYSLPELRTQSLSAIHTWWTAGILSRVHAYSLHFPPSLFSAGAWTMAP